MTIDNSYKIFLDLVRASLWKVPADASQWDKDVDWDKVYEISKQQTLKGMVIDAILDLPADKLPQKDWYEKKIVNLMSIAQESARHQAVVDDLLDFYNNNDIYPLLMKGITMSNYYAEPQYRLCGDIDLFVGEENYDRAISLLIEKSGCNNLDVVKDDKHTSLIYKSIEIELHRITEFLSIPKYDKEWQKWTSESLSPLLTKEYTSDARENGAYPEFPLSYNLVYLFNHIWHHFCIYGIGLRQFCDWAMYLHKHANDIDLGLLEKDLKRFGIFKQWQMFGIVLTEYLGFKKDIFPFFDSSYKAEGEKILSQVFMDGNFGKTGQWLAGKPDNYLKRKIHSLCFWFKRLKLVWEFSPEYSLFTVIDYILYGFRVVFNDFKNAVR